MEFPNLCSFYTIKDGKITFCNMLGQEVEDPTQSGAVQMLIELLADKQQRDFRIHIAGLKK
jgi:hypothetical protein